jgi:hypothetical protein
VKSIQEPSRSTPVIAETEVLVIGSGPGGLAAAISAAREGVQTMLVERYGCFGGVITQVGVNSPAWYRYGDTTDIEGIGIEIENRALEMSQGQHSPFEGSQLIDTELFKPLADTLVLEAGVEPLLHSYAVDAILEDNTIKGIITESKSGRGAILAGRVIDASGDADIVYFSGAPIRKFPKEEMLGVTVLFSCSGVDVEGFLAYVEEHPQTFGDWGENWDIKTTGKEDDLFSPYLEEPFRQAKEDGLIPPELTSIGGTWSRLTQSGEAIGLNMVYMLGLDGTDVRDLTRGEMEGRKQAMLAVEALRSYVPGFENANLRNFGMTLGTRDTRKIIGRYSLTDHDVRSEAKFDDSIGIFPEFLDGYGQLVLPTTGRYFQVPFGITVPEGVENLLVAGRCVSSDKLAHAALRSMMCCTVTGQGAGVAAAISLKDGVACREVDINRLQAALYKQGVRLA